MARKKSVPADPDAELAKWDCAPARDEGWTLWHSPEPGGRPSLCFFQSGPFASSGHAIAFVRDQANAGSEYHTSALRLAGLL